MNSEHLAISLVPMARHSFWSFPRELRVMIYTYLFSTLQVHNLEVIISSVHLPRLLVQSSRHLPRLLVQDYPVETLLNILLTCTMIFTESKTVLFRSVQSVHLVYGTTAGLGTLRRTFAMESLKHIQELHLKDGRMFGKNGHRMLSGLRHLELGTLNIPVDVVDVNIDEVPEELKENAALEGGEQLDIATYWIPRAKEEYFEIIGQEAAAILKDPQRGFSVECNMGFCWQDQDRRSFYHYGDPLNIDSDDEYEVDLGQVLMTIHVNFDWDTERADDFDFNTTKVV